MSIDFQNLAPSITNDSISRSHGLTRHLAEQTGMSTHGRLQLLGNASSVARLRVDHLLALARRGLPRMYRDGAFGHTLRAVRIESRWTEQLEGDNLRYLAMVALGLSFTDDVTQRQILNRRTAADLARLAATRAEASDDAGAVALAAWAAAEVGHFYAAPLFQALAARLASNAPIPTVDCAWALTAAVAARRLGDTSEVIELARRTLSSGQSAEGLFPHILPASAAGRMRAHIGSFADQVYPIQAFSRLHAGLGDADALSMAEATAARICALQGPDGQWWWHYNAPQGNVGEGYPVYSVHQHAMAPMALLDLREAGGSDYLPAIIKGLRWLDEHPEVVATLVNPEKGVVWRKVARREPNKAVRAMAAVMTSISPRLRLPGVDVLFPPSRIDYECRPYELGWLLYAWLSDGVIASLGEANPERSANVSREV
jgi:hypothetical protein